MPPLWGAAEPLLYLVDDRVINRIDTEWKPQLVQGAPCTRCAVVQVSTLSRAYVVDMAVEIPERDQVPTASSSNGHEFELLLLLAVAPKFASIEQCAQGPASEFWFIRNLTIMLANSLCCIANPKGQGDCLTPVAASSSTVPPLFYITLLRP